MIDYLDQPNRNPKPFQWRADADLILRKIAEYLNESLIQDTICGWRGNFRHGRAWPVRQNSEEQPNRAASAMFRG